MLTTIVNRSSLSGNWKPLFSAKARESQSESSKTQKTPPRILVIDDEVSIADSLVEILRSQGFEATAFYRGQSAIDFARKNCPDIVLLDVVMPKLNGVETAVAIRQLCPATRILLFSGQAGTTNILEQAREGGHEFELLSKPLHPDALLKKLRS